MDSAFVSASISSDFATEMLFVGSDMGWQADVFSSSHWRELNRLDSGKEF